MRNSLERLSFDIQRISDTENFENLPDEFHDWVEIRESRTYQEPGFENEGVLMREFTGDYEMPVRTVSGFGLNLADEMGRPVIKQNREEKIVDLFDLKTVLREHHEIFSGSLNRNHIAVPEHVHRFLDSENSREYDPMKEVPGTVFYSNGTSDPVLVTSYDHFDWAMNSPEYRRLYDQTSDWMGHVDYDSHTEIMEEIQEYRTPFPILFPNTLTDGQENGPDYPQTLEATLVCSDDFMVEEYKATELQRNGETSTYASAD